MGIIRLLLALAVIIVHTTPVFGLKLVGAEVAVNSFFIISGFYMSLALNEKYKAVSSNKLFYKNRFLRLYPLYYFVWVLTLIGYAVSMSMGKGGYGLHVLMNVKMGIGAILYAAFGNVTMLGINFTPSLNLTAAGGLALVPWNGNNTVVGSFFIVWQAWSLSLEILFYILAPYIVRRNAKFVAIFLLVSVGLRYILAATIFTKYIVLSRFFPTEVWTFLLGVLSYKLYVKMKTIKISNYIGFSLLAFMILFTAIFQFLPATEGRYWIYLICMALSIPLIFNSTKELKFDKNIGELSYPLFISHIFIRDMLKPYLSTTTDLGFIVVVVTILLGMLQVKFIIEPINKRKYKIKTLPQEPIISTLQPGSS